MCEKLVVVASAIGELRTTLLNNLVPVDKDYFLTVNTNSTWSNGLKLYKSRFSTTIKGHSFSQRVINDWSTLPFEIVSAPNALIFTVKINFCTTAD